MPVTKEEARGVYEIVNGYFRQRLKFFACDDDADCTPFLVCGEHHRPGKFETMATPVAWYVAGKMATNLSHTKDWKDGGGDQLAFLISHEIGHHIYYPAIGIPYYIYWHVIDKNLKVDNLGEAYRCQMDFIVNEALYRDKALNDHLRANGLSLYHGAQLLYEGHNPIPAQDRDIRQHILSYNYVAIWRETEPARFAAFRPRPTYDAIHGYCDEFLNSDYKHWDADRWFEYALRTLTLTARLMS